MQRIGMIGVGLMGHGIASNVQKAGYPLALLTHPGNQPLDALIAGGAKVYDSAKALTADSDIVILCVTGTPQVESVMLQPDGVLAGLAPGGIIIDCSTTVPASTERLAARVIEKHGHFLDAPMTRTPKEAAEGRLNLLVGGDVEVFNRVAPLLRSFAECVRHVGPAGSGHRMKLLHNFVSLGTIALISEAAACAAGAGIEPSVFIDVLASGGGGGAALKRLQPYLLERDVSALRFSMRNAEKDMDYYTAMAAENECARDIALAVKASYAFAAAVGPERMVPELIDMLGTPYAHCASAKSQTVITSRKTHMSPNQPKHDQKAGDHKTGSHAKTDEKGHSSTQHKGSDQKHSKSETHKK